MVEAQALLSGIPSPRGGESDFAPEDALSDGGDAFPTVSPTAAMLSE